MSITATSAVSPAAAAGSTLTSPTSSASATPSLRYNVSDSAHGENAVPGSDAANGPHGDGDLTGDDLPSRTVRSNQYDFASLLTTSSLTQAELAVGSTITASDGTASGQVTSVDVNSPAPPPRPSRTEGRCRSPTARTCNERGRRARRHSVGDLDGHRLRRPGGRFRDGRRRGDRACAGADAGPGNDPDLRAENRGDLRRRQPHRVVHRRAILRFHDNPSAHRRGFAN